MRVTEQCLYRGFLQAPRLPGKARKKPLFFIKSSKTALDRDDFADSVRIQESAVRGHTYIYVCFQHSPICLLSHRNTGYNAASYTSKQAFTAPAVPVLQPIIDWGGKRLSCP